MFLARLVELEVERRVAGHDVRHAGLKAHLLDSDPKWDVVTLLVSPNRSKVECANLYAIWDTVLSTKVPKEN